MLSVVLLALVAAVQAQTFQRLGMPSRSSGEAVLMGLQEHVRPWVASSRPIRLLFSLVHTVSASLLHNARADVLLLVDIRNEIHAPVNGSEAFRNGVPDKQFEFWLKHEDDKELKKVTDFFGVAEPA